MANSRVVAILQARMGSTRLQAKVLAHLLGQPMLAHIIKRVSAARHIDEFVVATTQLPQDDPIEAISNQMRVECFRGAEEDCLDRYYQAATKYEAATVVRLTGDNPLVDAGFVDSMLEQYAQASPPYDYIDSSSSKTYPVGLSVEVFSYNALAQAWLEDTDIRAREHVTPFIYSHPERFRIHHLANGQNLSQLRWTVDTAEDLALVRRIYEAFGYDQFSWLDVLALLERHTEWSEINRHVEQRAIV